MPAIRFAFAIISIAALCSRAGAADDQPLDLRVMSFNIRYGTAADGANHWDERREFLVDTIRRFDPDLLGTQKTLGFQRDYNDQPGQAVGASCPPGAGRRSLGGGDASAVRH